MAPRKLTKSADPQVGVPAEVDASSLTPDAKAHAEVTSPIHADDNKPAVVDSVQTESARRPLADPWPIKTKTLGDGYKVRLQQSRRSNQMQIKFGDGTLNDKPPTEILEYVKEPDGKGLERVEFHWNNDDRAWGMRIDMNAPKTSREQSERVFDEVVKRLGGTRGVVAEMPF